MLRPAARSRKQKPLSESLHRRLSLYTLAAGGVGVTVLALVPSAEAEVVYTKVLHKIGRNDRVPLDLNHDGITDFQIDNVFHVTHTRLEVWPAAGNYAAMSHFGIAEALPRGAVIRVNRPSMQGNSSRIPEILASIAYSGYYVGYWFNVRNGYLGFGFKIDGKLHYGWARLTVILNRNFQIEATLTGFAYETEPETPIIAGDTGNAVEGDADSGPNADVSVPQSNPNPVATLGALALGAQGLQSGGAQIGSD
jgi:hypothetical protein